MKTYLGNGVFHDLLVLHIALVTNKQLVDTLGGVAVDLLEPLLHVVEGVHVGNIVNHTDAVGTAVVGRGDGTETFLAGSIPLLGRLACARVSRGSTQPYNLKFHSLAIEFDCADFLFKPRRQHHLSLSGSHAPQIPNIRSPHRLWRCSFQCRCHRRNEAADKTFQHRSHR